MAPWPSWPARSRRRRSSSVASSARARARRGRRRRRAAPRRALLHAVAASASGATDPAPDRGGAPLAGQALEFVDVDPPALGDDPIDGAVGSGLARGQHRAHVEDLAAADRLAPAALPQHVAVAGRRAGAATGRWQAVAPCAPSQQREHLAPGTDRRRCGRGTRRAATPRGRGRERRAARSRSSSRVSPLAGTDEASPRCDVGVADAGEVDRDTPAGTDASMALLVALQAPARAPAFRPAFDDQFVTDGERDRRSACR